MSWLYAVLQGILQGVTEFLPISSDGHLSVFSHFFGSREEDPLLFVVLLHLGTLFAVFIAYRKKILSLIIEAARIIRDIFTGRFRWGEMSGERRLVVMVAVSLIPLALLYFVSDYMEYAAADSNLWIEAASFLFSGVMMLMASRAARSGGSKTDFNVGAALLIGFFQGLAALPGVSRSGSTIAVALMLGYGKEQSVDFSFIIGIPAVLAANAYKILKFVISGTPADSGIMLSALIGIAVSAIVGLAAIHLLKLLVKKDKFHIFGYYCLAMGMLCAGISVWEMFSGQPLSIF